MSDAIDYKAKYLSIRQKLIQTADTSYRMGFQAGMQQAQMQQAQEQAQQAQMQAQQAQQQVQQMQQAQMSQQQDPNQQEQMSPEQEQQAQMQQAQQQNEPTEMDQHIAELEELVNKSENLTVEDLMKSVEKIKAAKIPKSYSFSYEHNMSPNAKRDLSMQEKIVSDMLNKWESEEKSAKAEMSTIIGVEGLLSKAEGLISKKDK